ncbi:FAD-binding oxidoreductase [Xenorhabdus szentirmaii]|uniref:FAD linked oxidase domain protein n=1 Tax=Xenorhabdus szentirmaii DSM 16338 TaxID=1427518 RepID=W1J0M0_9GAMM|nr:FAD-binding oxidoreductase [Xenorhabdus szentirmaii]PHM30456.1 4-cresol dehydrogenase flavoprotein subunit [Xenorhabdus szentirmaii DSM 16338]CDL83628.1 FAD linked oxidase domain protein [Xenorhabdus szentirmaii DSM 16338]
MKKMVSNFTLMDLKIMDITEEKSDVCSLNNIIFELKKIVGEKYIQIKSGEISTLTLGRNVSLFTPKKVSTIVRPGSINEIIQIVDIMNKNNSKLGLHIVSSGYNWGLGSKEPVNEDAIIVILDRLTNIRDINIEDGWAIIEPGVTQLNLANLLKDSSRMLNVTASSGHTSVIGNILERGVGLRHQRTNDLLGLEVITPDGEKITVGWWPHTERKTAFNTFGHGPSLLHLYTQSNLGIVTGAVVRLLPRPQTQTVLHLHFPRKKLLDAVNLFRDWYAQEMVSGVLKIYDTVSTESYGGSGDEHLTLICVSGNPKKVEAIVSILFEEAKNSGIFTKLIHSNEISSDRNDFVLQVVEHAYAGDPSWNEHMLRAATGQNAKEVDSKGGGWIFFLAFIPFKGETITEALSIIDDISKKMGVKIGTTVNALSSDVIDLVISIKFPPVKDQISKSHETLDLIYEHFTYKGFYPYRLDINHTNFIEHYYSQTERAVNKKLKNMLDPNGIISTGRYF